MIYAFLAPKLKRTSNIRFLSLKTVQRLPKDVREKVLGKANFIVAGEVDGTGEI